MENSSEIKSEEIKEEIETEEIISITTKILNYLKINQFQDMVTRNLKMEIAHIKALINKIDYLVLNIK